MRKNYGLASFEYGRDVAASGNWRYGDSNHFTAELHGEATAGLIEAGTGGVWLIGKSGGIVSGSIARSMYRGRSGSQASFGYSWNDARFNFSLNEMRTYGDFLDVASLYGAPPPRVTTQAVAGYSVGRLGQFGVSYLDLRYPQQNATRYGSVYWFKPIGRALSLSLSAIQNLDNTGDRSVFAGINIVP